MLSLQKFTDQKKIKSIPNFFITKPINNWLDTAKLINSVDSVITVDTSVAHLAAAMGKNTHVLIDDFYYTPIDKNPNWYSCVKIWRGNKSWNNLFKNYFEGNL